MTAAQSEAVPDEAPFDNRLAVLLAAAMFVLAVDTSLMNVSISSVVHDLGTTVSGVQSGDRTEALVSAAFILISSKVGDIIGRKRAYIPGLLGYAAGALAMVLAQDLRAIIVFWSILGGLGASLLLPSMQSLIHGNFEGAAQKRVYALVGARRPSPRPSGRCSAGSSPRSSRGAGFLLELVIIAVVLSNIGRVRDVPYTGDRRIDYVGALFCARHGGIVLGILGAAEGAEAVGLLIAVGVAGSARLPGGSSAASGPGT